MADRSAHGEVPAEANGKVINHRGLRYLLIAAGFACTALGVLGIFLPLLPTVPLLLLAAACFARGSERCYRWLLEHRHLGPMVSGYLHGHGIPRRARWTAITLVWISIPLTVAFAAIPFLVKILLIGIGAGITVYLLRLPTLPPATPS